MAGILLGEGTETPAGIDIINDDRPCWPHVHQGSVHLEANVVFAVHAVVNEKVDLPKPGKQLGKQKPARALDVRPSIGEAATDRHSDLRLQKSFYRRKVDA